MRPPAPSMTGIGYYPSGIPVGVLLEYALHAALQ
jgi:hypothetical protein